MPKKQHNRDMPLRRSARNNNPDGNESDDSQRSTQNLTCGGPKKSAKGPKPAAKRPTEPTDLALQELQKSEAIAEKKKRGSTDSPTEKLIHDAIRLDIFRRLKFCFGPKQRAKLARECLKHINLAGFDGKDEQSKALVDRWVEANQRTCLKRLNKVRGYAQTRIGQALEIYMHKHNGQLPTSARLEQIIKRDLDMADPQDYEDFDWWWNTVLPKATANQAEWNPDKRHYVTIIEGAPVSNPNAKHIAPSTEAFVAVCVENNRNRWPAIYHLKRQPEHTAVTTFWTNVRINDTLPECIIDEANPENARLNHTKYHGIYTDCTVGQVKDASWSRAGIDKFEELRQMSIAARKTDDALEVEKAYLAILRAKKKLVAPNADEERRLKRKRKRANSAESDTEEEAPDVEWEE